MMTLAAMLKKCMEETGVSKESLADTLGVPDFLVAYLLDPQSPNLELEELLASALQTPVDVFRGEKDREPTPEQLAAAEEKKRAAIAAKAKYPAIRKFMLGPQRCMSTDKARELFGDEAFSLAEKNLVLYLSTNALYEFCDTQTSSFSFDEYLFKLHAKLLEKYEKELSSAELTDEEKEERLNNARSNVFCCDTMENIAILVLESFAAEFEEKLNNGVDNFAADVGLPFAWEIDDAMSRIIIRNSGGEQIHEIKLLDVRAKG